MNIEIILLAVIGLVFLIDYLLRKKKKPKSTEVLIPDNSKTSKTKYFIRIGFISIIILACVYFYHFFPKKIVEDVNFLISSEKYEEAFKKIDNFKTIYGKTINSDSLENEIHEIRISNYKENITFRIENLDSIRQLEKYYDSYDLFNYNKGVSFEAISNKYEIFTFQCNIAEGLYDYHQLQQSTSGINNGTGQAIQFAREKDSIKKIIQIKLKEARFLAFDEKSKKYSDKTLGLDALTSNFTGDLRPIYKLLELDNIDNTNEQIIELFLIRLAESKAAYFDDINNPIKSKKIYYDFARKVRDKIKNSWYAERILFDEIFSEDDYEFISDDIFFHNIYEKILTIFPSYLKKDKLKKVKYKELKKLVEESRDLDRDNYSNEYWINFYWIKSSIYFDFDKNVSLEALYTLENELSADIENKEDVAKGILARVLFRIARIKSEKNDNKGALEYYQSVEKLYDFRGKDLQLGRNISPDYSDVLYQIFIHKWNTKPFGPKDGACEDLKLAGKINVSDYYDYYIKTCD